MTVQTMVRISTVGSFEGFAVAEGEIDCAGDALTMPEAAADEGGDRMAVQHRVHAACGAEGWVRRA